MYHVYCEVPNVETLTPDWNHAQRAFRAYVREYPNEEVVIDRLDDYVDQEDYGPRVLMMRCVPWAA